MKSEKQIKFKTVLKLCEKKIPPKPSAEAGSFEDAFHGGAYLGSPGKDIYFILSRLTDEEFDVLAERHSHQYPKNPPSNHVGTAACIRYIYGQFEKQGILRSKDDRKRMIKEAKKEKLDWNASRRFIIALREKFKEQENYYGLCLTSEMEAHRLGDEAYLHKDRDKLKQMEETYLESVKYAHKCKSYKQMFTPYYWASRYFMLFKDAPKAIAYSRKTIEEAEKHCPDARRSYVDKLEDCAQYLKKNDKKWKRFRKIIITGENRVVRKLSRRKI